MEKEELKLEEQEAEETTPLVRKSRNKDDSKIAAISDIEGEVRNGLSTINGHKMVQNEDLTTPAKEVESESFLEDELESINWEQEFEESDGILENKSESTNGVHRIEESNGILENTSESTNGEHKIEEGDRVLENEAKTINGKLKIESEPTNGDEEIGEGDGILEHESDAIKEEQKPENLVFHDEVEGVDSVSKHIGEEQLLQEPLPIKLDVPSHDSVVQNTSTSENNDRSEETIEEDGISSSHHQPSDASVQEGGKSCLPPEEIGSAEVDPINVEDLEITESDVERVIHKQTTHDLFCPNCKSCITKRVVLRKRKRRTRAPDEEAKRNRIGGGVGPGLDAISSESPEDRVYEEGEDGSNDAQVQGIEQEQDGRDREPDLFRCLSCFSFFIPNGDGFKLFKTNWFSKMFVADKQETAVQQGSSSWTNVRQDNTVIPSSWAHQSMQPPPARVSETKVTYGGRDVAPPLPISKPSINGKVGKLDTEATEGVGLERTSWISDNDQLMESKSVQQVHTNGDNDLLTNGESDGLGMLIASSEVSSLLKPSEEVAKPNQTVQRGDADQEVVQFSPPSVSVVKASDADGTFNVSLSIPHDDQDVRATIVTKSAVENRSVDSRSTDSGEASSAEVSQQRITETKIEVNQGEQIMTEFSSTVVDVPAGQGKDTVITIDTQSVPSSHTTEDVIPPATSLTAPLLEAQTGSADRERAAAGEERKVEVIKSIVYGGLAESVTSLSVVSSAVGGGAATFNVLALGAANLIGGLFVISHNLWDLKSDGDDQVSNQITEQKDRYRELLGRRQNFMIHAVVAVISYLVFGLVAPVSYGFSFRESENKELKLLVAASSSLFCILMLAIAKAYVQRPPKPYLKTITTFIILGFMVSGASYAAGHLVERLLEKLGLFEASSAPPSLLGPLTS